MADVAQLGLAVDSSQVKSATAALNQLNAASSSAAKGADQLASSSAKSDTVMRAIAASAKRMNVSTEEMEKRFDAAAAARNKLNAASQTAVKGMTTLSDQTQKVANDNKSLGQQTDKTTGSLNTFATRFTRGLIAGIAIQGVRDLVRSLVDLNAQLAATADISQRVGTTGAKFQGLQTAASYKGVGNDTFNSAMLGFNQQIDLARHGLGDLQTLLRSNGKTVSDTATTFGVVADLVKNAGSEAEKFSILQQAGLPATREFAKLMEQGGASINKQADAAGKLSQQQLDDAKRINDAWNKGWTDFENWGKRAVVNVLTKMGELGTSLAGAYLTPRGQGIVDLKKGGGSQLSQDQANSFYDSVGLGTSTRVVGAGATKPPPTFDPALAKQQIALEQQRLGLLSPLATAEDVVKAKQLEINAAALNNVGISKQQADALKLVTLAQFEMNRVNQQAQIGVFNLDAANKAAQDTLKSWVAQKLLDPNNEKQMAAARTALAKSTQQLGDAAKVAATPFEGLQRLINEGQNLKTVFDQTAVSALNGVDSALLDITTGTVSAADGFKNLSNAVIRAIEDMIIKITIITPLATALKAALGGLGGLGSGLMGGGSPTGYGVASANGNVFPANDNGISRWSNQVVSKPTMFAFANGVGLMGEAGAEAIMPLRRGPDGKLGVRAAGAGGGTPNIIINNQTNTPVQQSGVRQNANGDFEVTLTNAVTGVLTADAAKNGPISKAFAARQAGFGGR